MLGIGFALCCLLITAVNDFVFKLFARKERSKGLFCAIIGIFWMAAWIHTHIAHEDRLYLPALVEYLKTQQKPKE